MITLVLEASTYAGSAAILEGSSLLVARSIAMRGREHEALLGAVGELLAECGFTATRVGRIVCGAGPGSFTSLRIAASIAKGMAAATGAPIVAISSLSLLVASAESLTHGRYLAVVDAMRGESYVQEFGVDAEGRVSSKGSHRVVATALVDTIAVERGAVALGPSRSGAEFVVPHSRSATLLTNMIEATPPADLAAWEPAYGRLSEAQVKWEAANGRALDVA